MRNLQPKKSLFTGTEKNNYAISVVIEKRIRLVRTAFEENRSKSEMAGGSFQFTASCIAIAVIAQVSFHLVRPQTDQLYVHNLDKQCLRCLCYAATSCDITLGCKAGYCGPYKISRLYWIDAGRHVLPEDDPERAGAFEDCALNFGCAQRMVTTYMSKFGKDCNDDNVTDCNDYLKINFNGGYQCTPSLDRNEVGINWTKRFDVCYQLL